MKNEVGGRREPTTVEMMNHLVTRLGLDRRKLRGAFAQAREIDSLDAEMARLDSVGSNPGKATLALAKRLRRKRR